MTSVEVNHKPKHYCPPHFKFFRDLMAQQQKRIFELIDVVGQTELKKSTYQNFKEYFLKSNTF